MDMENALEASKNYLIKNVFEPVGVEHRLFEHPGMNYYLFVIADEMVRSVLEEGGSTFDLLKIERAKTYTRAVINETKERFVSNLAEAMAGYGMRNDPFKNKMAERQSGMFMNSARSIANALMEKEERAGIEPKTGTGVDFPDTSM